jgi:outer membrane protein insertion porin family
MFVDVTWEKRFSEDMHRAKVIYTIQEGPKVRVGQIRIEGAETTSKRLIRERLTLGTGSLITPDELEKSQVRLMELGIFNGATVQMASPEVPSKTKNLKIQVSEAKPQYLEFRWGIASVEGLRAGLEYGFNNIGGYALNTRFRARANYRLFFVGNPEFEERYERMSLVDQLEHHVLVGIGSPHLPGTYGLLGWGVDVVKERINKPGFSADRLTTFLKLNIPVALGAKYPHGFLLETRTGFEYNIEILQGLSNDPFLIKYLRLPQGESAFYVVGLAVSLDLRDSPFNPTEGFFLSIGGDWVKSVPVVPIKRESNLIRSNLTASGYVKVFDTDLVVALSFSVGYIFHLKDGSITWPDRYFYVGGIDTLRGFPEDSLMPEDLYNRWKAHLHFYGEDIDKLLNTTGGEATLVTRAELRYPLAKGFYGAGFGELGNVWRKQSRMHPVTLRPLKVHLRPVAGLGIRYLTPLGPISFDLGINLKRRPREDLLSWYLSIGTAF